jgi:hypothetical protein
MTKVFMNMHKAYENTDCGESLLSGEPLPSVVKAIKKDSSPLLFVG